MKGAWSLRLGLLATSSPAFEDHLISACRVFRTPSGPPGASLCAAPPRPRGVGGRYAPRDFPEQPAAAQGLYFRGDELPGG